MRSFQNIAEPEKNRIPGSWSSNGAFAQTSGGCMDRWVTAEIRLGKSVLWPKVTRLPQLTEVSWGAQRRQDGEGLKWIVSSVQTTPAIATPSVHLSFPGCLCQVWQVLGTTEREQTGLPLWHSAKLGHKRQADYNVLPLGDIRVQGPSSPWAIPTVSSPPCLSLQFCRV